MEGLILKKLRVILQFYPYWPIFFFCLGLFWSNLVHLGLSWSISLYLCLYSSSLGYLWLSIFYFLGLSRSILVHHGLSQSILGISQIILSYNELSRLSLPISGYDWSSLAISGYLRIPLSSIRVQVEAGKNKKLLFETFPFFPLTRVIEELTLLIVIITFHFWT